MNGQEPEKKPSQNSISEYILHAVAQAPGPVSKLHPPWNSAYFGGSTSESTRANYATMHVATPVSRCVGRADFPQSSHTDSARRVSGDFFFRMLRYWSEHRPLWMDDGVVLR